MVLTTEIRLKDPEGCAYLDGQLEEENKIFMYAFKNMKSPKFKQKWKTTSKFNTHLCEEFGILSRRANSIIYRVQALLETYRAHKEWEIIDKTNRLEAKEKELEKKEKEQKKLKGLAAENKLSEKRLRRLRNLNTSIYHLKNKINALKQSIKRIKKDLKNGKYRIGIGTKKLFKAQHNLKENGFKDLKEWREAYRAKKSHMILYIGRAAETGGNQMCTLFINKDNGTLSLRLRKENKEKRAEDKYIWFDNLCLRYLKDEVYFILKSPRSKAITIRFLKRGKKWYLQIMFEWTEPPVVTDRKKGVLAIDFNNGFLQQGEIDSKGNLVALKKRVLHHHGQGNRALNEMREQVKDLVIEAGFKLKSIAIEDLDFQKKKTGTKRRGRKQNRRYNKMLSTLDYRRFREELTRCAGKFGIEIIPVSPYNTSKIAAEKYCPGRCLTVHQGAAMVIGRRAMGFTDELVK